MLVFLILSRADNSAVRGPIGPKFELVHDIMHVLVTCKYKKDWMKNYREKVETPSFPLKGYGVFFRLSRADNSVVRGPIRPKFELVHYIMHVLITCTCKFKKDWINDNRQKVETLIV